MRVKDEGDTLSVSDRWDLILGNIGWFAAIVALGGSIGAGGALLAGWRPHVDDLPKLMVGWAAMSLLASSAHVCRFDKAKRHVKIAWRGGWSARGWQGPLSAVSALEVVPGFFWTRLWVVTSGKHVLMARAPAFLGVAHVARPAVRVAAFLGVPMKVRRR